MSQGIPDPTRLLDAIEIWMRADEPMPSASSTSSSHVAEPTESERSAIPSEVADLRLLMCAASAAIRTHAATHGCQVRLEMPGDPLVVRANPTLIEAAMTSLLRRSIDAHSSVVSLLGEIDDDKVSVRVDDDGLYSAPVTVDLDDTVAGVMSWSARLIGLAAQSIIEDHGGRLDFITRPGRGGSACFILPRNCDGTTIS